MAVWRITFGRLDPTNTSCGVSREDSSKVLWSIHFKLSYWSSILSRSQHAKSARLSAFGTQRPPGTTRSTERPVPEIRGVLLRSKWAAGKAVRAGLAVRGSISEPIRDRRATQPPAHFHRNPPGRGQLAVFPRCSLDPYDSDMGASLAP